MKTLLYLVSFLCGMNLLAFELIGSKLLAPYFGTSFHVWSATLFVSLLGIALGYYFAGKRIKKSGAPLKILSALLSINAFVLLLVPLISTPVFNSMLNLPFVAGILLAVSLLFFPVFFLLGTASPFIIAALESRSTDASRVPGSVFAVSTIGGVLGIYLFGFDLIPEKGLEYAFYVVDGTNLPALLICFLAFKYPGKEL
ncbi:MAG: fused MFS/spermidine synthase [Bacteroidota bacterium]